MSEAFAAAFKRTVGIEGKYSNNPADRGGETMYGITEAVARAEGYTGPMNQMPLSVAQSIYRRRYWDVLRGDDVATLSASIAAELFDTGVNMGTSVAATFLQRSLNALNRRQRDYPDVLVDGVIGGKTVAALRRYLAERDHDGETVMLRALNSLQGARYIDLAEKRPVDETFEFGWLANRVAI